MLPHWSVPPICAPIYVQNEAHFDVLLLCHVVGRVLFMFVYGESDIMSLLVVRSHSRAPT